MAKRMGFEFGRSKCTLVPSATKLKGGPRYGRELARSRPECLGKRRSFSQARRRTAKSGEIEHPKLFGELAIHQSLAKKPMPIPDEASGRRKIRELVRRSKRPLHLADFCEHIGTPDPSHAAYHVRRAERASLIKKVGHRGGWVVIE